MARIAIITPYYREDRSLLERCLDSVRAQSVSADHFLIADGVPQDWLDQAPVRHFKLDRSHGDFGNTPRGVGALIAIAEEYDAIGMLDADNWLEADHVEVCLDAAAGVPSCDYVIAQRIIRRADETVMPVPEQPGHVDTNCFFFLRGSFAVVPRWATQPKVLSSFGDQIFYQMIERQAFNGARAPKATVNYSSNWEVHYRLVGETPPKDAKPSLVAAQLLQWLQGLPARDREIASRLAGIPFGGGKEK